MKKLKTFVSKHKQEIIGISYFILGGIIIIVLTRETAPKGSNYTYNGYRFGDLDLALENFKNLIKEGEPATLWFENGIFEALALEEV